MFLREIRDTNCHFRSWKIILYLGVCFSECCVIGIFLHLSVVHAHHLQSEIRELP